VQPPRERDCAKALADQRLIRAFNDYCVVEVAVPQRGSELDAVELAAEPATVFLVGPRRAALHLVAQGQRCSARAELFEDRQVDSVGVQLERNRQMLEAPLRAQQEVEQ